jgi:hypothetical protein
VKQMNRATADNQSAQSEEEGLEPTKEWMKDLIDEIIAEEFSSPDLELHWLDEDTDAAGLEASLEGRVKLGAVTLNEMRDSLGLDPYANPAADRPMVLTPTGYVPIEANAGGQSASANRQSAPIVQKRSLIKDYDADQPRVPAGNPGGGQWTSEGGSGSSSDSSDASGDVSDDDSSDSSNDASGDGSEPGPQYAALDTGTQNDASEGAPSNSQTQANSTDDRIELADAANDNLTPEQMCQQAFSDGMASARINPSLSPDEYLDARFQLTSALELCLNLANGVRPISPGGNFVEFSGAGTVIFKQGIPPFYVPFPGKQ